MLSLRKQGLERGLLVNYLGLPIAIKRLSAADCIPLSDAITNQVRNWTSMRLSFAGRVQLIGLVLSSLQAFRSSIIPLTIEVCMRIDKILCNFL
ncbi:hypothetical protein MLD38_038328 [Melastoma candidum]|uniref:Uncharacterized protein n=1 Tax=Melastoma candidum TaxID=119954 RepID=A0ACB9KZA3_9MYRT|nr:hypothetical protein MLD38_040767 [Melastoma candidum]KAI4302604.1 hypothetical protein MLD38_038328 [Melastoma candidum]